MRTLLDPVILIDFLNGFEQAQEYLFSIRPEACISVVTRAEVLAGFDIVEHGRVAAFLDGFNCLVADVAAADIAGRLRRTERWKLPDAFQAALAQRHGLRFATRNTKDFPPDRYPFVEVPYRLAPG